MRYLVLLLGFVLAAQAQAQLDASEVGQPQGWNDDLKLAEYEDLNPDPDILEINMEAKVTEMEIIPGKMTPVWTYNGTLPGPLIRTQPGQRLIVHFKNSLPEETSIHWHGLLVPNDQDGVVGFTQAAIQPGEEFTYDFVVPNSGTYWYHPHMGRDAAQLGYGLYGPIVVDEPDEPEEVKALGDELILVLSDISLDAEGQFLPPDIGEAFGDLFGREGEILLVNGKVMPKLKVRQGKPQRWRVINAARTRYYTLRYKRTPMIKLGGDGGLAAHAESLDQIKLVPSERLDMIFTPPDAPGTVSQLRWYPTDRGYGTTFNRLAEDMMVIETVDEPAVVSSLKMPETLRTIEPIDITGAIERKIDLTIEFGNNNDVIMGINGIPHSRAVPIEAKVNTTEVWTVHNPSDFAHPFHLHGFAFQVLDQDDKPLEWKDTVDVPVGATVRFAVHYDDRPGMWMYHCHILDHAEVGMMGHLHVSR